MVWIVWAPVQWQEECSGRRSTVDSQLDGYRQCARLLCRSHGQLVQYSSKVASGKASAEAKSRMTDRPTDMGVVFGVVVMKVATYPNNLAALTLLLLSLLLLSW